MVKNLPVYIMK